MSDSLNPYQSPHDEAATWEGYAPLVAQAKEDERTAFIRRTYTHLLSAIVAFVILETALFAVIPQATLETVVFGLFGPWTWLIFLGGFMFVSWIARSWAVSTTSLGVQYAGLALYVVAEAILFVPLLYMAVYQTNDPNLLPAAGLLTLIIFGGLTAATFVTKHDFSYLGTYLWWGGIAAFGILVVGILMGFSLGFWFSAGMIVLASGYILYHTSNVIHHYRTDQHVAAALALCAAVALLFWYVLQILMSRR